MKHIENFSEYSSYGISRHWKNSKNMSDIIWSIENLLIELKEKGIAIFIHPGKSAKSISIMIDYRDIDGGNFNGLLGYIESLADFMSLKGFIRHTYNIINDDSSYPVILEGGRFIYESSRDMIFNNINCINSTFKV